MRSARIYRPSGPWLEAALRRQALSLLEQRVYVYLLNRVEAAPHLRAPPGVIAEAVGVPEGRIHEALERLQDLEMIRPSTGAPEYTWRFPLGWYRSAARALLAAEQRG